MHAFGHIFIYKKWWWLYILYLCITVVRVFVRVTCFQHLHIVFSQGESFAAIEVKLSEQWNLNFLKYVQETTGEEADMMTGDDEM